MTLLRLQRLMLQLLLLQLMVLHVQLQSAMHVVAWQRCMHTRMLQGRDE